MGINKNTKYIVSPTVSGGWDLNRIIKAGTVNHDETELWSTVHMGRMHEADIILMPHDIELETGEMIVLCDPYCEPIYGFVNTGCSWKIISLPIEVREKICPPTGFGVDLTFDPHDRHMKWFKSKKSLENWIVNGFHSTEGAEREHYEDMMYELNDGSDIVHYNQF